MKTVRAKDPKNKKWIFGYYFPKNMISNDDGLFFIDPSTLCSSTGVKDDQGNELFESDIIQSGAYFYLVKMVPGAFIAKRKGIWAYLNELRSFDIKGNLYEPSIYRNMFLDEKNEL